MRIQHSEISALTNTFGTLFRTTDTLAGGLRAPKVSPAQLSDFSDLNCHLDIPKTYSIKILKLFKTARVVSMIVLHRFISSVLDLTYFSNVLVLSASLISYILVFVFQMFWFECCWREVTQYDTRREHTIKMNKVIIWRNCRSKSARSILKEFWKFPSQSASFYKIPTYVILRWRRMIVSVVY